MAVLFFRSMFDFKPQNRTKLEVNRKLISDIVQALENVKGWGSIEVFVQDNKVVQITQRNIVKTKYEIKNGDNISLAEPS